MKSNTHVSIYFASSLIIISLIVGMGIGYWLTPQYSLSMYDKGSMDLGPADRWLDLRYINAMIAHHRGAILLAQQAEKSTRSEIHNLAIEIQKNEPPLINELYAWKKDWYDDSRQVRDPQVARLGEYNDTFDLRFLNALVTHHKDGVRMTTDVRLKSSRTEIIDNADAVEQFLITSGEMLSGWRSNWYQR